MNSSTVFLTTGVPTTEESGIHGNVGSVVVLVLTCAALLSAVIATCAWWAYMCTVDDGDLHQPTGVAAADKTHVAADADRNRVAAADDRTRVAGADRTRSDVQKSTAQRGRPCGCDKFNVLHNADDVPQASRRFRVCWRCRGRGCRDADENAAAKDVCYQTGGYQLNDELL